MTDDRDRLVNSDRRTSHGPAGCERELMADPSFDRFRCQPALWMCSCGKAWAHFCDEAEGCSWARMPGNDAVAREALNGGTDGR